MDLWQMMMLFNLVQQVLGGPNPTLTPTPTLTLTLTRWGAW